MTIRRVLYLLCLGAAALFYIFDTGLFSFVLLVLGIAFVPMELLVSLPGLLGARVCLAVSPGQVRGGAPLTLLATARARQPFCSVRGRLCCQNLLDGSKKNLRFHMLFGLEKTYAVAHYGATVGVVRFSLHKLRVVDVAGLFAFPLPAPGPVAALALPEPPMPPPALPKAMLDTGGRLTAPARPGPEALREFTDIRAYREGDSLRDVHWKLTAKFAKVMVREDNTSAMGAPQLCFDYHGEAEAAGRTLGRLEALSNALWQLERLHRVHWLNADGTHASHLIDSKSAFDAMLWALLETPLPAEGPSILKNPPALAGPMLLVKPGSTELYVDGQLKEVAE